MSDAAITLTPSQRAAAIERIGENVALRSGAGCGKTFVLARRFTELLRAGADAEAPLSRLVALTFTDKAALEMSQRVRSMLEDLAAEQTGDERRRTLQWLADLPEARISTIHSFCAAMLRSHAIDAGIDPGFAVCSDNLLAARMVSEAAEAALIAAVEDGQEDVAALLADVPLAQVTEQIETLVSDRAAIRPEQWTDPAETMQRWRRALVDARTAARERLGTDASLARRIDDLYAPACSDPEDKLNVYRAEQLGLISVIASEPDAWTPETFAQLRPRPGRIGSAKAWGTADDARSVRDGVKKLVADVAALAPLTEQFGELDDRAAACLAALSRLTVEANERYTAAKRSRGLLDFTDLLIYADRLLADRPAVREALAREVDQFLVDECQDTDAFQIGLLERLVLPEAGAAPPPGRLFVVGDAKQSIYRFRGADVEVFEKLCSRLGDEAAEDLDRSFRTHAAGVAFVNHLFASLMGDEYAPIQAHRETSPPHPSVEILLAETAAGVPPVTAADAVAAQAAVTAQRIHDMVAGKQRLVWDAEGEQWRPVRYGDIAILFSRMTHSLAFERELADRGVPYYVLAGTGFFKQQEVYDVLNALTTVDNPYDDVAFFGALRSSLFALDDNVLMHLAEAIEPPYLPKLLAAATRGESIEGLLPALGSDRAATLSFAVGLFADLHARKDALGVEGVLEALLEATAYPATLLAQASGRRMLGNVRMLLDQARGAAEEALALADFVTQISEQVLSQSRYEQAAVSNEADDVVRLLTIHRAKGLEFPVVVLPDLNAGRRGFRDALLHRRDWGVTYRLRNDDTDDRRGAETPLAYRVAASLEDADQQAEDLRRLYVALTRHEDHLVLVGANYRTAKGDLRDASGPLGVIDSVLGLADAVDRGRKSIPYAGGAYEAAVRTVAATPPSSGARGKVPPGRKLLAACGSGADLAAAIARAAPAKAPEPPLIAPLPASVGRVELAVTALSEFARCPSLYRWRHELRVPPEALPSPEAAPSVAVSPPASLDPATAGTVFHRCMEHLDFAHPQSAAALLQQALADMDLDETACADALAADLDAMLERFQSQPLWRELADAAELRRELDFVLHAPPATLRGQIDLLARAADGAWRIVDYKSDRVGPEGPATHAARYELQMHAYAAAAAKHLGVAPTDATLYFLRTGDVHRFEITPAVLESFHTRAGKLADELIVARRTGDVRRTPTAACEFCPYRLLCPSP